MENQKEKKAIKEHYLLIPYHILNNPNIGPSEKVLLAHIYSFGEKGCWQSNKTLGEMFFVSTRTISTWVTILKKAGLVFWVHPKGRYRTIWAKTHPKVKTATTLLYMGQQISKEAVISGHAAQILLGRNLPEGIEKSCTVTAKDNCIQVGRNLLHTINTTKKDTNINTIATPSPLPAWGQAPALLESRSQALSDIERFKQTLGKSKTRQPLNEQEFEQRRAAMKKQLMMMKDAP
jgi:hypothetical protein